MARVAMLGTGIMGSPMAGRLRAGGLEVVVWNRTAGKTAAAVAAGCTLAASPWQAVTDADFVLVMLSTGPVVEEVLLDARVVAALSRGATVIVMSSIPVDAARHQAQVLEAAGVHYVDAPVSGGERGAVEGTLAIMAGGDAAVIAAADGVFRCLGRVTHVGPAGSGQLAKLANQLIVGITIGAVAEALLLVEAGGANPAAVREALLGGFADSTILRQHGERMIAGRYQPGAKSTIQLKDLRTALSLGNSLGARLPLTTTAHELFDALCGAGYGDWDHSAAHAYLTKGPRAGND